jgi:sec-independent protein translocase protein TatC
MTKNNQKLSYSDPTVKEAQAPLVSHLIELRKRLVRIVVFFLIVFGMSAYVSEDIFQFLARPLADLLSDQENRRLIYTALTEAFMTYLKVALFAAFFITLPYMMTQIWRFIAPALFAKEKKAFLPFLAATPLLFLLGASFAYYIIIPNAWAFFLSFEAPGATGQLPIQLEAKVGEYLSLVMQLLLAFGFSFQLPIALVLFVKAGLISLQTLQKNRKYAFLILMIAAAFLTPPDVVSMLGLGIPLYILYELAIIFSKMAATKTPEEKS